MVAVGVGVATDGGPVTAARALGWVEVASAGADVDRTGGGAAVTGRTVDVELALGVLMRTSSPGAALVSGVRNADSLCR